jgi:hypothetical protein
MAALAPAPKAQFFDANGAPLVGGKLYSYAAGTTTPLATYTDQGGSTPNANPVILDSRGEASVWLGTSGPYKLRLTSATDVDIWTVDDIYGNLDQSNLSTYLSAYLASPAAIGGTTPAAVSSTNLSYTGTLTGGTGVVNFGAGQFYKDASGNVGVGTSSPSYKLDVSGSTRISGQVGINRTPAAQINVNIGSNITGGIDAQSVVVDGTVQSGVTNTAAAYSANPQVVNTAFTLSSLIGYVAQSQGSFGSATVTNNFGFLAASTISGAANNYGFYANLASGAGKYNFYAAGTAANWFSGDVLVFGAGGLGYTTGSGGTQTQTTGRTNGVTLNKTNGAITLVSAAGTTAWQSFTVTNSTVAATDTVIVSQKSGTDLYQIFVRITFATTGGTTTEQPVFNFAVVKAVTA